MACIILAFALSGKAQKIDPAKDRYMICFDSLTRLISENGSFKKAVFLTENCFLDNEMKYESFETHIAQLTRIIQLWQRANPLMDYHYSDSANIEKNFAIFKFLKDTTKIVSPTNRPFLLLPYTYDFVDFFGHENWTGMFVTKLLSTHKGNCHSLPYLYKILADELEATCWLALAPNHTYISNRCTKFGWYNTELTSGDFPVDAWIMGSGYIPVEAIQNGIYMDTLSNQQSIALCLLDLAKGYEHKTRDYYDGYILKCCNLSLRFFEKNVEAMLLKAETLKRVYLRKAGLKDHSSKATYQEMEDLYVKLFNLGYREMPEKMYMEWLQTVIKEREKYTNKEMKEVIGKHMPGQGYIHP